MARWRPWLGLPIVVMALWALAGAARPAEVAAGNTGAAPVGGQTRPAERVSPAPQVNANAVIWRTPTPPASPQAGDVWVSPKDGAEMVYVSAGEFLMGSAEGDQDAFDSDRPQHRVYLDAYWIDKTSVTAGEYRRFCQATGRTMPPAPGWEWQEGHPIVMVTWDDASAYARWARKRLPTEAEWEKAARGTDGREYPWGHQWDPGKCANPANSRSTQPVGSYPGGASPYGVQDMAGNVWQWCGDWYDGKYYRSAPARNPTGPTSGVLRVLRGGSWRHGNLMGFRGAFRFHRAPDTRDNDFGFRCVRGLP